MEKIHRYFNLLLLAFFILIINLTVFSQSKKDIEMLNGIFDQQNQKTDYKTYMRGNSNEFQLLASGLFLFYKSLISSQDGNHCVFNPSCSVYMIQSIKKNGILIGFSYGIDRLMRCNRLTPENYERFETTNLLSDPVWESNEKE